MPSIGFSSFVAASNFGLAQATLSHSRMAKERDRIQTKASLQHNLGTVGSDLTSRFMSKLIPTNASYVNRPFQLVGLEKIYRLFQRTAITFTHSFDSTKLQFSSIMDSVTKLQAEDLKKKSKDSTMVLREWKPNYDEDTRLRNKVKTLESKIEDLEMELEEIKKDIDFREQNR